MRLANLSVSQSRKKLHLASQGAHQVDQTWQEAVHPNRAGKPICSVTHVSGEGAEQTAGWASWLAKRW